MEEYLEKNHDYWQKGYQAENVESFVFRPYGVVFKAELGIDGSKHEKCLDFGCGQGAALGFFKKKGFDVYGVDISQVDIECCKQKMPEISEHFAVIDPKPRDNNVFFGGGYDVVLSIQTLYYLSDHDLGTCLMALHQQMKPGAIFYATMMGTRHYFYDHSAEYKDGLRKVVVSTNRFQLNDYYINFTSNEDELLRKLSLFKKIHIGYYDHKVTESEGSRFHYTFIGQKT